MKNKLIKVYYMGEEYLFDEIKEGWKPGSNTVAYYPFKDDILDHVGSTSITFNPSSVTKTKQTIGYQFLLNSTTQNSSTINNLSGAKTMSVWTKRDSGDGGTTYFKTQTPSLFGACYSFAHWQSSPNNACEVCDTNGCSFSGHQNVVKGQWYHMVITRDGTTYRFYIQGELVWSVNKAQSTPYTFFVTGGVTNSELIYESKARTDTEVSSYFNSTKSNYGL